MWMKLCCSEDQVAHIFPCYNQHMVHLFTPLLFCHPTMTSFQLVVAIQGRRKVSFRLCYDNAQAICQDQIAPACLSVAACSWRPIIGRPIVTNKIAAFGFDTSETKIASTQNLHVKCLIQLITLET